MTIFLHGGSINDAIKKALKRSGKADFAVAYWGHGALERLSLDEFSGTVRILCDLESLCCNPDALSKLLDRGFEIRSIHGLHAKVYIADSEIIVGSANASRNGLGDEGAEDKFNDEAALWVDEQAAVQSAQEWFCKHWNSAEDNKVDPARLKAIKPLWKRNKARTKSFLSFAKFLLAFAGKQARVVVFDDNNYGTKEYDRAWEQVRERYLNDPEYAEYNNDDGYPFYVDWGKWDIKPGEYVISYGATRKSAADNWKPEANGWIWQVDGIEPFKGNKGRRIIYAKSTTVVSGIKFDDVKYKELFRLLKTHFSNSAQMKSDGQRILLDKKLADLPSEFPKLFGGS